MKHHQSHYYPSDRHLLHYHLSVSESPEQIDTSIPALTNGNSFTIIALEVSLNTHFDLHIYNLVQNFLRYKVEGSKIVMVSFEI